MKPSPTKAAPNVGTTKFPKGGGPKLVLPGKVMPTGMKVSDE